MAPNMFYGDYKYNKNLLTFLISPEETLATLPHLFDIFICTADLVQSPRTGMKTSYHQPLLHGPP